MDTIIYIYLNKNLHTDLKGTDLTATLSEQGIYNRKEYDMGDYRLIQIGMCEHFLRVCQGKGLNTSNSAEMEFADSRLTSKEQTKKGQTGKKITIMSLIEKVSWVTAAKKRYEMECAKREEAMRWKFFREIIEDRDHSFIVCQDEIPFLTGLNFREYLEEDWIMHMMGYARLPHYLILGKVYGLYTIIRHYAREMKSLKWILLRRQFKEEDREFVEYIYEEYGLTMDVRLIEEEADYKRGGLLSAIPVVVVDFCEEERIPVGAVPRGSIWIDMISSEEKYRRLEERDTGIYYFSLKKEWKQPQKALNILDTTGKNGYNT
ncbi:MAG: hypothetical protein IJF07_07915 [Lachnospiraceae bacterium]|nr:hypothetical protein [Lachnospiraceae bacterium]